MSPSWSRFRVVGVEVGFGVLRVTFWFDYPALPVALAGSSDSQLRAWIGTSSTVMSYVCRYVPHSHS